MDRLLTPLFKGELIRPVIDLRRIIIVGSALLLTMIPITQKIFEFVALPKISSDSALRGGLLYMFVTFIVACLYILYKRHRAYYSSTQRLLARACTVAATALSLPLLWTASLSLAPGVANYSNLAPLVFGLVAGGGAAWVILGFGRDCGPPSEHIFIICELGEGTKRIRPKSTYLAQVIVDGLRGELRGEEHRIRVEHLREVVLDEKRARRLGANAQAAVIVYGYFVENLPQPTSAKLFAKFEVLRPPRFYPGVLSLEQGALVGLDDFGLETELTKGAVALSCFLVGLFYYWEKRYEEALGQFTKAQGLLPAAITSLGLQETLLYRGNALYRLDRYDEAIDAYTQAISVDSSFARAYNNRGACYGELAKALAEEDLAGAHESGKQAINDFSQAIDNDPDLAVAYLDSARVYRQLGLFKEAVEHYTVVIRSRPKDPDLYLYRGEAHAKLEAYEEAICDFSKVVRLSPNNMFARRNRAGCYHHLEDYAQAISDYTRVTQLAPNSAHAAKSHRKVGDICSTIGEPQKAIDSYTKALKLDPDNAVIYVNRGNKMLLLGRFNNAANDFTQAITLNPALAKAHGGLGNAHIYLGEVQQGIESLIKALALDPDYESAKINLQRARNLSSPTYPTSQLAH